MIWKISPTFKEYSRGLVENSVFGEIQESGRSWPFKSVSRLMGNSAIIYKGPSLLDGAPIVVVAIDSHGNNLYMKVMKQVEEKRSVSKGAQKK
jgi:hypothetical protein